MQYFDRHEGGENAILVHLDIHQITDPDDLEEFRLLVHSAGANEIEIITGSRSMPNTLLVQAKPKKSLKQSSVFVIPMTIIQMMLL